MKGFAAASWSLGLSLLPSVSEASTFQKWSTGVVQNAEGKLPVLKKLIVSIGTGPMSF